MFDRRLLENFDWGLLVIMGILVTMGLLTLYSAVTVEVSSSQQILCLKQLVWYSCGLIIMILTFLLNYKVINRFSIGIYIINIFLLISVLMFGKMVGGARRWLVIGQIAIQPSELIKIAVIIILASYYSKQAKTTGFIFQELIL